MQIFIIGSVLETAQALDKKRFHRQISEAKLILDSIDGKKHWKGPLVEMYRSNRRWLESYIECLEYYKVGDMSMAANMNTICNMLKPDFHKEEYFTNMKKRLYTKDKVAYNIWENLGESDVNMYWNVREECWIYKKQ